MTCVAAPALLPAMTASVIPAITRMHNAQCSRATGGPGLHIYMGACAGCWFGHGMVCCVSWGVCAPGSKQSPGQKLLVDAGRPALPVQGCPKVETVPATSVAAQHKPGRQWRYSAELLLCEL